MGGDTANFFALSDRHRAWSDFQNTRVEERGDFARLEPVLNVGPDPILDGRSHFRAAMDKADVRASPEEIQGRLRGGILSADDDDFPAVKRIRLAVIVRHMRKILT